MSEETYYDVKTQPISYKTAINTTQWLAEEYEAGNDGQ